MCVSKVWVIPGGEWKYARERRGESHFCLLVRLSFEKKIMDSRLPKEHDSQKGPIAYS